MGSLTAHLVESGDHGRLRFHPSCPVCRQERLFGTLSSEPVVSRRAQAVLAGGVLALSGAAPAAAVGREPDRQHEGIAAPDQPGGVELHDPGFDPGGETALPFDTAPVPADPGAGEDSGDGAPLEVEPDVDLDARLVPLADVEAPAADDDAAVPPAETVSPVDAVPPGDPLASDPSLEAVTPGPPAEEPTSTGEEGAPKRTGSDRRASRGTGRKRSSRRACATSPDATDYESGTSSQPYVAPADPVPAVAEPVPAVAEPVPAAAEPVAIAQASAPSSERRDRHPRRRRGSTSSSRATRSGRSPNGSSVAMPRRRVSRLRSTGSGRSMRRGSRQATLIC